MKTSVRCFTGATQAHWSCFVNFLFESLSAKYAPDFLVFDVKQRQKTMADEIKFSYNLQSIDKYLRQAE